MIGFLKLPFLWVLTGIVIPVAIHLLSRKEADIIYLGSLRHLNISVSRQFKSIRLNQLLLLLLRILLIIILAFILSGLWFRDMSVISGKKWMIFEKGTENNKEIKSVCDSLKKQGYESHYLTAGFPKINDNASIAALEDYWTLSNQLEKLPLTDVIIFSYMKIERFRGRRPSPPTNQHWISLEQGTLDYPLTAFSITKDSLMIRMGSTNSQSTSFINKISPKKSDNNYFKYDQQDSVRINHPVELAIDLVTDPLFENDRKIFLAAIKTVQESFPVKIIVTESKPANYQVINEKHFVIWLSEKALALAASVHGILYRQNDASTLLLIEKDNHWVLTQHLTLENAIDKNLTISLAEILLCNKTNEDKEDRRIMPAAMLWSSISASKSDSNARDSQKKTAEPYLLFLFVLLLCIERFIAYQKNQ